MLGVNSGGGGQYVPQSTYFRRVCSAWMTPRASQAFARNTPLSWLRSYQCQDHQLNAQTIQYIENNLVGKRILSLHATKSAFVAMNDKYMIVPWGHTTVGGKMSSYAFEKENGWADESSASTISKTIFTNSYTVFVMAQIPGENTRDGMA